MDAAHLIGPAPARHSRKLLTDSVTPESNEGLPSSEGHLQSNASLPLTEAEILAGLKDILARIAGADPEGIELDALIIDDVGVDSLGFYEILIEADETMGIKIQEKDLLTFKTVRDIVDYVTSRPDPGP